MAILKAGSVGSDVRNVQAMLNGQPPTRNLKLRLDGAFGPKTRSRVEEFQSLNGLRVDGVVGPETLAVLRSRVLIAATPVRQGNPRRLVPAGGGIGRFGIFPLLTSVTSVLGSLRPNQFVDLGAHFITAAPSMPDIELNIRIQGVDPDPTPETVFEWTVNLVFNEAKVSSRGKEGVVFREQFVARSTGARFRPQFQFKNGGVRGGDLIVEARAVTMGNHLVARFEGEIRADGRSKPDPAQVNAALGNDTLRKIIAHESGGLQFQIDPNDPSRGFVPVFNKDPSTGGRGDGGAGIGQITPPSFADIWDWRVNCKSTVQLFHQKEVTAKQYLNEHRIDGKFPNDQGVSDEEVILREVVQRYRFAPYWRWNTTKNIWEAKPSASVSKYVEVVLGNSRAIKK